MKKLTMVATLLLLCLGAVAQPMRRPQGPLNEFSAMEGTTALQYNLPMKHWLGNRRSVPDVKLLCQINNIFNSKYASNGGAEASRFADGSRCTWYYAQAGINVHAGFVVQW